MTSQDFRVEKDSLGELPVPAGALYGVQTERAVQNFPISGLHPWRAFIWSIAIVKRAAAEVNFGLGLFHDREVDGRKVILPVWHNIDAATLRRHSPMLADRLATSSSKGLEQVIIELLEAVN